MIFLPTGIFDLSNHRGSVKQCIDVLLITAKSGGELRVAPRNMYTSVHLFGKITFLIFHFKQFCHGFFGHSNYDFWIPEQIWS